jgi:hypothetical protein
MAGKDRAAMKADRWSKTIQKQKYPHYREILPSCDVSAKHLYTCFIEQAGLCGNVCLILGRYPVRISASIPTILLDVFRGFPQFLQVNARIVLQIRLGPLPSTYFSLSIHYSFYHFKIMVWDATDSIGK